MKIIFVSIVVLISVLTANAQEKLDVTLVNDTVYHSGKALFTCKGKTKEEKSIYFLRSLDTKPQAMISFTDMDTVLKCSASFPDYKLRYDVLYPKITIDQLMESFVRNKVMVEGKVDTLGLIAYCNERSIPLQRVVPRQVKSPLRNDSMLIAHAKEDMAKQVKFNITNNSKSAIYINIGVPSNNRTILVARGATLAERARIGDKVCILDKEKKQVSCREVKKDDKEYKINSRATEFE